jgi:hypothetical protein
MMRKITEGHVLKYLGPPNEEPQAIKQKGRQTKPNAPMPGLKCFKAIAS